MPYSITTQFDTKAQVWFISHTDVPGLVVEAETPAAMMALLRSVVPVLAAANDDQGEVIYSLTFDHFIGKIARRGTGEWPNVENSQEG